MKLNNKWARLLVINKIKPESCGLWPHSLQSIIILTIFCSVLVVLWQAHNIRQMWCDPPAPARSSHMHNALTHVLKKNKQQNLKLNKLSPLQVWQHWHFIVELLRMLKPASKNIKVKILLLLNSMFLLKVRC